MKVGCFAKTWVIMLKAAPVAYMAFIYFLSAQPGGTIPVLGIKDYILHFFGYFVLGLLLFVSLRVASRVNEGRIILFSILVLVAYAFADEYHQMFVPGRTASFSDVIADILGGTTAILLAAWLSRRYREWKRP